MAVNQLSDKNPDGTKLGQSASDLIAFYGTTPVSQRASSVQATIASSASFGATQAALVNEIVNTLTGLGLWKGGA
jgi:hypothetical protein